ncbi:MAG: BrnT family toxin [Clostridiaceae bacterium]|jgi:uncharacterized DUF497 family protein|nr:BrnT family toxin [Clostridiaceae bacterium]
MEMIRFEWDEDKNKLNQRKHGLSFEEASTVFADPGAILFDDPDHSLEEERFLIIGLSENERFCVVSHCYRDKNSVIRLISARKATKNERTTYLKWQEGKL